MQDIWHLVFTQNFTTITPDFRRNLSKVVFIFTRNGKNKRLICEEFLHELESDEIKGIFNTLKINKYTRFEIPQFT